MTQYTNKSLVQRKRTITKRSAAKAKTDAGLVRKIMGSSVVKFSDPGLSQELIDLSLSEEGLLLSGLCTKIQDFKTIFFKQDNIPPFAGKRLKTPPGCIKCTSYMILGFTVTFKFEKGRLTL